MKPELPNTDGLRISSLAWRQLLTEGAAHFNLVLSEDQIDLFQTFAQELLAWNQRINLTTITAPTEVALKHFIDSLAGVGELEPGWRVVDVGSGGGFPGIPLKIVRPDLNITLVDAVRKKTSFQKQVLRLLGLKQIKAVHTRVETLAKLSDHRGAYDAVVTRAFTDLSRLGKLCAPLLTADGVLVAYRGRREGKGADCDGAPDRDHWDGWRMDTHNYRLPYIDAHRTITRCVRCRTE